MKLELVRYCTLTYQNFPLPIYNYTLLQSTNVGLGLYC